MKNGCRKFLKSVKNICHIFSFLCLEEKTELNRVIDKNEDFICIIKVMNDDVFGEEALGKKDIVTGETLIL